MKRIVLILLVLFLFTACSVNKIEINKTSAIENILKSDTNLTNTVSPGYKYYIPNEVILVGRNEYNETLYSRGDYYYLYVDVVSYYNKVKLEYEINKDAYYSSNIKYKDKEGYIEITKSKDKYFVEFMYNYAKLEAYVNEKNINNTVLNASYILSSLKFNEILAESKFGSFKDLNKEENLNVFIPKREEGTFLDIEEPLQDKKGKESEL